MQLQAGSVRNCRQAGHDNKPAPTAEPVLLQQLGSLARYPCHIIALAEYRARLECATLLRIADSAA